MGVNKTKTESLSKLQLLEEESDDHDKKAWRKWNLMSKNWLSWSEGTSCVDWIRLNGVLGFELWMLNASISMISSNSQSCDEIIETGYRKNVQKMTIMIWFSARLLTPTLGFSIFE